MIHPGQLQIWSTNRTSNISLTCPIRPTLTDRNTSDYRRRHHHITQDRQSTLENWSWNGTERIYGTATKRKTNCRKTDMDSCVPTKYTRVQWILFHTEFSNKNSILFIIFVCIFIDFDFILVYKAQWICWNRLVWLKWTKIFIFVTASSQMKTNENVVCMTGIITADNRRLCNDSRWTMRSIYRSSEIHLFPFIYCTGVVVQYMWYPYQKFYGTCWIIYFRLFPFSLNDNLKLLYLFRSKVPNVFKVWHNHQLFFIYLQYSTIQYCTVQ